MLAKIFSCGAFGIEAVLVEIEVDLRGGLPGVVMVGLPDAAVKESRDRIRSAVSNSGFEFPSRKCVVNLAPADLKKEGPKVDGLPLLMDKLIWIFVYPLCPRFMERVSVCGY